MSDRGALALDTARQWLGTPVRWEASVRGVGCDCRGLLAGVARELEWPEGAAFEASVVGYARHIDDKALIDGLNRLFDPVAAPRAGDILAFRIKGRVQHLAMHAGPDRALGIGRMIHAYQTEPSQVVEVPLVSYWARRLAGAWRWRNLDGC